MKIREIMSRPIIAEDEETLVTKIAEDMDELGIGSVAITSSGEEGKEGEREEREREGREGSKGGKPVGIITERDIALKVLLKDKRASEVKAREIMSSPLVTVEPETTVDEACKLAARKRIKRLPVVENGRFVGIVSIRDLLARKPEFVREFYF
ncbi:MAG: CBS domain-containing protein [Candidatus Methanospirareceae archaeon]|nr:CBS domain-containing protein [Methanophagales archaeon]